jgi:hypothetical protein
MKNRDPQHWRDSQQLEHVLGGVEHGLYRNGLGDGVEGARIDLLVNCAESPASPGRRWAK